MVHPSLPPLTDTSRDSLNEENTPSEEDAFSKKDPSSVNEASYSNTGLNPQPLSIQWLCLEKIIELLGLNNSRPIDLGGAIEELIQRYNNKTNDGNKPKSAKKPTYREETVEDEDVYKYAPYQLKKYVMITQVVSVLNSRVAKNQTANVNPRHILFYYHNEPYPIIFAMTHDRAFMVVKDYVDHSFPTKVAAKIGNPKHLIYLERRPLFGAVKKTINTMDGKGEPECSSSLDLYHLTVTYECEIKCDSSLAEELSKIEESLDGYSKPAESTPTVAEPPKKLSKIEESPDDSLKPAESTSTVAVPKKRSLKNRPVTIMVRTSGILRINRRIDIEDYPKVLTLLANYMRGERTCNKKGKEEENDPLFAYLHHLYPVDADCRKSLNKSLMKEIFRQYRENREAIKFSVLHKYVDDFLHADKFQYQIIPEMSYFKHLSSRPPMLRDILAKIIPDEDEECNEENFVEKFKNTKLKFSKVDEKKKGIRGEPLINYIEGELYIDKSCHFKIRNMWYTFTTDYTVHLHRNFKSMVKTALIGPEDSEARLSREWAGEDEDKYSEGYLEPDQYGPDNGYLVFDKIFDKGKYTKMESVEFCDIFKFVSSKDTMYLYHVKREFLGEDVREVTSQLLNAAKLLRASISLEQPESYLQRLWAYINTKQPEEENTEKKGEKAKILDEAEIRKEEARKDRIRRENAKKDAIRQYFNSNEAEFLKMFGTKKITFVYAYQPDPDRTLSNYISNYFRVTPDTFTGFGSEERKSIFLTLVECKYLDVSGELTGKFYKFAGRADFKLEGKFSERSGEIFDYLKQYKPVSASTIALLDLVRVAKQIKDLNFDFKISEIPCPPGGLPKEKKKKKKKKKEETVSSEADKSSPMKGEERKTQTSVDKIISNSPKASTSKQ